MCCLFCRRREQVRVLEVRLEGARNQAGEESRAAAAELAKMAEQHSKELHSLEEAVARAKEGESFGRCCIIVLVYF